MWHCLLFSFGIVFRFDIKELDYFFGFYFLKMFSRVKTLSSGLWTPDWPTRIITDNRIQFLEILTNSNYLVYFVEFEDLKKFEQCWKPSTKLQQRSIKENWTEMFQLNNDYSNIEHIIFLSYLENNIRYYKYL